ncbi:hypothetical protein GCM10023220_65910 [Streptomyces ziwulingensis]|uniref:Transposase n=1 Tax=Streptomyces ziwulingensis TaxID=1045501 RepID=A0ABP9D0J0_9ACTN
MGPHRGQCRVEQGLRAGADRRVPVDDGAQVLPERAQQHPWSAHALIPDSAIPLIFRLVEWIPYRKKYPPNTVT